MSEIILYPTADNKTQLDVQLENDTVWLSQKQMAELFEKNIATTNEHIKNIYREKELTRRSTIRKSLIVQVEGNRMISREIEYFSLDVIISVGYRVKSKTGHPVPAVGHPTPERIPGAGIRD